MKITILLSLSLLAIASCSDVKKSSQIATIDEMIEKTQSLKQAVLDNKVDSAREYSIEARETELRIKKNFIIDTVDVSLGNKMDRHRLMKKALAKLPGRYDDAIKGCDELIGSLGKLRQDIKNGDGDRSKYEEYIGFENSKLEQIDSITKEYIKTKKTTMATFDELYHEIANFSMDLLAKKQKTK